ncbi:MAG TPA: hypothetical protein VFX96_05435 [Pyrinomonadaceae bacterium]|nr:hypothetical protein [Pyrinomonadaceae bacterium]
MNNSMKPAIIGGLVGGILTALPYSTSCCCIWGLVGGAIAAMLAVKESQTPLQPGNGVKFGAIAGAIAAAIYLIIGIPLALVTGSATMGAMQGLMDRVNPEAAEQFRQAAEIMQNQPMSERIVAMIPGTLLVICLLVAFSIVGGLIGIAIFEKRKGGPAGAPPPPPPPSFGGATGS